MSGVPEGSILGPILFILYLNDLPECAEDFKLLSFADDTKCYKSTSNEADASLLQADLNRIGSWVETWKLNFNLSKFALVHFHSSRQEIATSYTMGDIEISNPEQRFFQDLGQGGAKRQYVIWWGGHGSLNMHSTWLCSGVWGHPQPPQFWILSFQSILCNFRLKNAFCNLVFISLYSGLN